MNKQYNELKEKIIEANKDIMDLKFGCKVLLKDAQDEVIIIGVSYPLMLKKVENNDEPYYEVTSYNGFFCVQENDFIINLNLCKI